MQSSSNQPPPSAETEEGDSWPSAAWRKKYKWLLWPISIIGAWVTGLLGLLFSDSALYGTLKQHNPIDRAWGYVSAAPSATKEVHLWVLAFLGSWFLVSLVILCFPKLRRLLVERLSPRETRTLEIPSLVNTRGQRALVPLIKSSGAIVYQLPPDPLNAPVAIYYCPKCYEGREARSVLQPDSDPNWKICPECGWSFNFANGGAAKMMGGAKPPKAADEKFLLEIAGLKTQKASLEKAVGNWREKYDIAQKQILGLTFRHEQEKQATQGRLNELSAKLDAALPKKLDTLETDLLKAIAKANGGIAIEDLAKKHPFPLARIEHHLDKLVGQNLIAIESKTHEELRLGSYKAASLTTTGRTVAVQMKLI